MANTVSRNYFPAVPRPTFITRARIHGPRPSPRAARRLVVSALLVTLGACRPPAPEADAPVPQPAAPPLASLATQPVALVPTQYLRGGDSSGWSARLGPAATFLRSLDSAIAGELASRATGRAWVTAEALARSARRNPGFTSDPYSLSAESLRHGVRRTNGRLGEPLASQMRSLVALTEARYALVPVEIRFEPTTAGSARAILRLVLIDARLSEIQWAGDVSMEDAMPSAPDIIAALADRVVDLLVAP